MLNRRFAFMRKTHLDVGDNSLLFGVLWGKGRENREETSRDLGQMAYEDCNRRKAVVDYRETLVWPKGPFGSVDTCIPVDLGGRFVELANR